MGTTAWGYMARTLEVGLLAAFVAVVLGLLLLAARWWRYRSLRASHDQRLAIFAAGAVATAQRGRPGAPLLRDAA